MSKNFKQSVLVVLLLAVVGIVIIGYVWSQLPSVGVVEPILQEEAEKHAVEATSTIENDCFTVTLSGVTAIKQEATASNCVLRAAVLDPQAQITISFAQKANAVLNQETGVTLRTTPGKYTEITPPRELPAGVIEARVFESDEDVTGFFLSRNGVLIVSVHNYARWNESLWQQYTKFVAAVQLK